MLKNPADRSEVISENDVIMKHQDFRTPNKESTRTSFNPSSLAKQSTNKKSTIHKQTKRTSKFQQEEEKNFDEDYENAMNRFTLGSPQATKGFLTPNFNRS